jgi:hypothetical protein
MDASADGIGVPVQPPPGAGAPRPTDFGQIDQLKG